MQHNWIIIPNKKFDKLESSIKFSIMILLYVIFYIIEVLIGIKNITLILIGFIGIYRIIYFLLDSKKEKISINIYGDEK